MPHQLQEMEEGGRQMLSWRETSRRNELNDNELGYQSGWLKGIMSVTHIFMAEEDKASIRFCCVCLTQAASRYDAL